MEPDTTWLPKSTGTLLQGAAAAAREALGADLTAVVVVGAAMHPERASRASRPEVLFVVEQLPSTSLRALARALAPFVKKRLRPRVITTEELEQGSDVFALEVAEWRARHLLIEGEDPFRNVTIEPADLRRTIEFNVRGLGRRLRNRMLVGGMSARDPGTRQAVLDALATLSVAAHHTLAWLGEDPPLLDAELIEALGSTLQIDAGAIAALFRSLGANQPTGDLLGALETILPFVDAVTSAIDGLDPSKGPTQ